MKKIFADFDVQGFWTSSDYAKKEYLDNPPTSEQVADVERQLGYRLPKAYVELMQYQNGGRPKRRNHRMKEAMPWSHGHIAITGIYSIGCKKPCSLCGGFGNRFWIEEWRYPPIGVYFAECPSTSHDLVCLDYRECGPDGEPRVVHVDQEFDYKVTFVTDNFERFIRGLEGDEAFSE